MTNQDRKTLAEALFAVAVENQSQKESRLATLEAENAKLRAESREFRGMDASVGIADPCPSCGQKTLFVGSGGHLTCSGSKCRNPCAIGDLPAENAKLKAERDHWKAIADEGRKAGREEAVAEECARIAERAMDGIVGAEIAMNIRSRFGGKA